MGKRKLTDEEKRQRKVERTVERFKSLRIHKCTNKVASKFQQLVRLQAIEPDGKLTCCSCGKRDYPGRGFDAGHWIGRTRRATIFHRLNCHPQCVACNQHGAGPVAANYDAYMLKWYGQETMDELRRLSNTIKQWTREELAELYVGYMDAIRECKLKSA